MEDLQPQALQVVLKHYPWWVSRVQLRSTPPTSPCAVSGTDPTRCLRCRSHAAAS